MEKINFENLPSTNTPINADNLNLLQNNIENAITETQTNLENTTTNLENAINGILESGSNDNGSYIKYADGTMIVYKTVYGTTDITTVWGNLYVSSDVNLGAFPIPFITRPTITVSPQTQTGTQYILVGNGSGSYGTETIYGTVCLARPNSRTGVAYVLDIVAIGRWK